MGEDDAHLYIPTSQHGIQGELGAICQMDGRMDAWTDGWMDDGAAESYTVQEPAGLLPTLDPPAAGAGGLGMEGPLSPLSPYPPLWMFALCSPVRPSACPWGGLS